MLRRGSVSAAAVLLAVPACIPAYRAGAGDARADPSEVGVVPGTNPPLGPAEQRAAHEALSAAVSATLRSPRYGQRSFGQPEARRLARMLIFGGPQEEMRGESIAALTFTLRNGREIVVHVWDDRWCFTGGPCRRHNGGIWRYLRQR